jgi:putative holliday junction resolvase
MSGAVGTAATAALEEVQSLRSVVDVEVVTVDERLTTVAAHGALRRGGQSSRARKSIVDQTAAAVILQSWLDRAGAAR